MFATSLSIDALDKGNIMNHFTLPFDSNVLDAKASDSKVLAPANQINDLADEFLMNFRISGKRLSNRSWDKLGKILDFVMAAEQTIAEQKARIRRLETLTTTDCLTGLLNRRGIFKELEQAISLCERHGELAIFVYIDLDNFKQVNDRFGHDAGDEMLKQVAKTLQSSIRQTDFAARLGGDEFALLLSHSDFAGGKTRTQFIQQQLNFSKCLYQGHCIPVCASFGIAEIIPGKDISEIIKTADSRMFCNKVIRES